MFDSMLLVTAGVLTGLVFGFLLQKARVTRYGTILGQFLFKDYTVLKVMLTAIVVGGIGIYGMHEAGWVKLHVKSAQIVANALGGLIFGVGMALAGYCPGTGVAALGDGSRHALYAVLGMILGAGIYAETYSWIKPRVLDLADFGKATFPSLTGVSPWWFVTGLALLAGTLFVFIERSERRRAAIA